MMKESCRNGGRRRLVSIAFLKICTRTLARGLGSLIARCENSYLVDGGSKIQSVSFLSPLVKCIVDVLKSD